MDWSLLPSILSGVAGVIAGVTVLYRAVSAHHRWFVEQIETVNNSLRECEAQHANTRMALHYVAKKIGIPGYGDKDDETSETDGSPQKPIATG